MKQETKPSIEEAANNYLEQNSFGHNNPVVLRLMIKFAQHWQEQLKQEPTPKESEQQPRIVEALQWTNEPDNYTDLMDWAGVYKIASASPLLWENDPKFKSMSIEVKTKRGCVLANLGEWVAKDIKGDLSVHANNPFEQEALPEEGEQQPHLITSEMEKLLRGEVERAEQRERNLIYLLNEHKVQKLIEKLIQKMELYIGTGDRKSAGATNECIISIKALKEQLK